MSAPAAANAAVGDLAAMGPVRSLVELVLSWTSRTIRARYQQSLLGWLWAVAQPASQAAIFTVVFQIFIPIDVGETAYPLFAYVALVPWTFTQTALLDMTDSLVQNMTLVTKIYFRREMLPVSAMLARVVDFAVAGSLTVGLLLYWGGSLGATSLWMLPGVLAVHIVLVAGLGLAAAAANVFYRDVRPFLQLALQLLFYASPVVYPLERVPEAYRTLYSLNPVVGILSGYRSAWLGLPFEAGAFAWSACVSVAALAAGLWFFRNRETLFADVV